MFASAYLGGSQHRPLISDPSDSRTGIIVVIPCYREPALLSTLRSLQACRRAESRTEVIILINESETDPAALRDFNLETLHSAGRWVAALPPEEGISFYPIGPVALAARWAGAGLARKRGMDEAVSRFDRMNKPEGIVVSLDADTLVEPGYLTAIEAHFRKHPGHAGATIRFSHPVEGLPERQRRGILLYEMHLRYYKEALAWTGYPCPIYTVGSAFAVTAEAYVKRGGMSRRKAGEDFYFLQNLALMGTVGEINDTCVYPSARASDRVPFGTGAAMKKWMECGGEITTYDFRAFKALKELFACRHLFYRVSSGGYSRLAEVLPQALGEFMQEAGLREKLAELSRNCGRQEIFNSRFFQIFNAFMVMKFMNRSHPLPYARTGVEEAWQSFAEQLRAEAGAVAVGCREAPPAETKGL